MKVKYICMSARACALESECIKIKEGIKMDRETKVSGGRTFQIVDFFLIFYLFFVYFRTENFNSQQDSNSDCQGRGQER